MVDALAGGQNSDIAKQLIKFAQKQLGEIEGLLGRVAEARREAKEALDLHAGSDVQVRGLEADVKELRADLRVARGVQHHYCHDDSCAIYQFLNQK